MTMVIEGGVEVNRKSGQQPAAFLNDLEQAGDDSGFVSSLTPAACKVDHVVWAVPEFRVPTYTANKDSKHSQDSRNKSIL